MCYGFGGSVILWIVVVFGLCGFNVVGYMNLVGIFGFVWLVFCIYSWMWFLILEWFFK